MRLLRVATACVFAFVLAAMCACASSEQSASSSSALSAASSSASSSDASSNVSQPAETSSAAASEEPANQEQGEPVLAITVGDTTIHATLENNSSAAAFADLLREGPVTVSAHDFGNFEKVGPLPQSLPTNDMQITTQPGDVILYQGNQVTIYYDQNTWSFTRLAHIDGATRESLLSLLGEGDVELTFSLT